MFLFPQIYSTNLGCVTFARDARMLSNGSCSTRRLASRTGRNYGWNWTETRITIPKELNKENFSAQMTRSSACHKDAYTLERRSHLQNLTPPPPTKFMISKESHKHINQGFMTLHSFMTWIVPRFPSNFIQNTNIQPWDRKAGAYFSREDDEEEEESLLTRPSAGSSWILARGRGSSKMSEDDM